MFKKAAISYFVCLTLLVISHYCCALTEGKPAPELSMKLIDGSDFNLKSERGHVVIVNFWATWCEPCRQEMPAIETYFQEHKMEGLRIVAISMDERTADNDVRQFMSKFNYPAAFSRDANYKGYGRIWRMPMTFVIDKNGILRKDGSVGEPKVDLSLLEKLVSPLLQK